MTLKLNGLTTRQEKVAKKSSLRVLMNERQDLALNAEQGAGVKGSKTPNIRLTRLPSDLFA